MTGLGNLVYRNSKLYFKDKGAFFSSLITPLILLVLYTTFLANVFRDSFASAFPAGLDVPDSLIAALAGGQLTSSLLAVSCVTVSFCCNMTMVLDKVTGARSDLTVTPVKRATLALGYYLSTLLSSLLVCFVACGACLLYLAATGWYMNAADVLLVLLDTLLLVLFGTALSSIVNYFLNTQGQISAVGTIVSSGYGFICGAYMPISQFGSGLRHVLSFLPGTYGTSLLRNHAMRGILRELERRGYPQAMLSAIRESVDCDLSFFGRAVSIPMMYLILCGSIAVLIAAYILIQKKGRSNAR